MNDPGKNKNRKNPRNGPIERFIWRDGDVKIIYDPSKDPNALSDDEKRRKRGLSNVSRPKKPSE